MEDRIGNWKCGWRDKRKKKSGEKIILWKSDEKRYEDGNRNYLRYNERIKIRRGRDGKRKEGNNEGDRRGER